MKLRKRSKSSRYRGWPTAKRGKKNRTRGSGSQGGVGNAGTGKRGDQKKTLVIKMTGGNNYFGKSKTLRRGTPPVKLDVINLSQIETITPGKDGIIDLSGYKILGEGNLSKKVKIKADKASSSVIEKIKESGSELILLEKSDDNKNKKEAAKK